MAELPEADRERIRAGEPLRQQIRDEIRPNKGKALGIGCATVAGAFLLIIVIVAALPGSKSGTDSQESAGAIKHVGIATPCTQTFDQLTELLGLIRSSDQAHFLARQYTLIQAGQSITLDTGSTVAIRFEMGGFSRVAPVSGDHAGAPACYVPSSVLR